ncbi:transposase [Chryseobacterium arthrosphaerae]|uniref:transposase n=1 Tax=Chryseobacterium arthrosphaerae TaxID=651561 RepID=UPI001BAEB506|nr:transposase [Chryseobacterium arthrosphaerae]QUY54709.1 transposase [Chryseobacterium arthrosphaerae]
MNFKNIHIGQLIKKGVLESEIEISRICKFLNCSEEQINEMYTLQSLDSEILLKWSKLLEYDFFRIYTQHLILYSPARANNQSEIKQKLSLPAFKKNIYTKEIIDFMLELIESGEKTKDQVIEEYRIPKTTLYKWLDKYKP